MFGNLFTRCLLLGLGYAYPAFQCYKTVDKNRVDFEELRHWCQYWIILAVFTVVERVADILISWLPLYVELKLAFVIYLWHPKTKGTGYVYESMLRPFLAKHERDIDQQLVEWRLRAWDMAFFCWHNCAELGQAKFYQAVQYLAAQSRSVMLPRIVSKEVGTRDTETPTSKKNRSGQLTLSSSSSSSSYSPATSPTDHVNRLMWGSPKSDEGNMIGPSLAAFNRQTEYVCVDDDAKCEHEVEASTTAAATVDAAADPQMGRDDDRPHHVTDFRHRRLHHS